MKPLEHLTVQVLIVSGVCTRLYSLPDASFSTESMSDICTQPKLKQCRFQQLAIYTKHRFVERNKPKEAAG
ncbi:hypothetical protein DFS33DRAFT_244499 [Desarmillaria ectypa]|nr:hypothetical protein DFS33DRAFT_244499 [Desarmillaria ectypa]